MKAAARRARRCAPPQAHAADLEAPGKGSRKRAVTLRRGAVRPTGKLRKQAPQGKRPLGPLKVLARDTKGVRATCRG